MYLDRYKYLNKNSFGFFSSISWGLCTGTKCEKVVLFGFNTGTKSEFRLFNTIYLQKDFSDAFFVSLMNKESK
jgi:hypothetical protein